MATKVITDELYKDQPHKKPSFGLASKQSMLKELENRLKGIKTSDDMPGFDTIFKKFAVQVADTKNKHQNFLDLT